MKRPTSVRLSPEAERLRDLVAAKMGLSKTAVLEQAIRALAKREGVK